MAKELMGNILYNESLLTPGYQVEAAIGTTYSLDLETLLEVPLALGELTGNAEQYIQRPYYLLDVINKVSGKFCVYCNAGSIYNPLQKDQSGDMKNNALLGERIMTLMEDCICQVQPEGHKNSFASFHPKVWMILERRKESEERQLKLMVMSKNLTYATDIDIACVLTGKVMRRHATTAAQEKHQPLLDLLIWLERFSKSKQQKQLLHTLQEVIPCVEHFDIDDNLFEDYDFHLMGVPDHDGKECLEDMVSKAGDTIVISPFIDLSIIGEFAKRKGRKLLITQPNSCTPDILSLLPNQVYATKLSLISPDEEGAYVNMHEKIYFINDSRGNRLYLGSTNATENGFNRNVELLLSLQFRSYIASFDKIKEQFVNDDKDCAFEKAIPYTIDTASQDEQRALQLCIRRAIAALQNAEVEPDTEGTYRITVKCKDFQTQEQISLCPIYSPSKKQTLSRQMVFTGLPLTDLTELYILECHDVHVVIKINTRNMPSDRWQKIYDRLLNTPNKVMDYLAYMLSVDPDGYMQEMVTTERREHQSEHRDLFKGLSLYEDLLKTAYIDPDRINRAIETLSRCSVAEVEDFKVLLKQMQQAIPKIKRMKRE